MASKLNKIDSVEVESGGELKITLSDFRVIRNSSKYYSLKDRVSESISIIKNNGVCGNTGSSCKLCLLYSHDTGSTCVRSGLSNKTRFSRECSDVVDSIRRVLFLISGGELEEWEV